jgi:RNA recognition motif-containing protein
MKRLFVGNLPWSMTEQGLTDLFAEFGGSNPMIPKNEQDRSKGFGFVEVDDDKMNEAIEAVNGKEVDGRPLNVNEARPREDRSAGGRGNFGGGNRGNGGGYGGGYDRR